MALTHQFPLRTLSCRPIALLQHEGFAKFFSAVKRETINVQGTGAWQLWLTPVILATQEAEIRRIGV
jgi:hypothetical protein